jgi:hypothetical protein
MHFCTKPLLLLGATNTVTAYLTIPWVDSVVELMTTELFPSVHYNTPSSDTEGVLEAPPTQQVLEVNQPPEGSEPPEGPPPAQPYWLEHILHQGVAVFNSDQSGYQVYRNVKDFGAKGNSKLLSQGLCANSSRGR